MTDDADDDPAQPPDHDDAQTPPDDDVSDTVSTTAEAGSGEVTDEGSDDTATDEAESEAASDTGVDTDGTDADATATATDVATDRSPGPGEGAGERLSLALRGAVGFLTRFPVGTDLASWEAFRRRPTAFVPVGYLVGALAALPFLVGVPGPTAALLYPVALVALVGINHADGLADLADAAAVHGEGGDAVESRRRVLKDSAVGVGGTVALAGLVAGLVLAALALAGMPPLQAVGIVLASEVAAKVGMALVACLGSAPFDGLGAQLARVSTDDDLLGPVLVAVPVVFASWPSAAAGFALVAGVAAALLTWRWAAGHLGGVNGDVFGAANELGRLAALHAGVVTWTLV